MVLERVFGVAVALEDVVVVTRSERRVESGFWLMKECWKDVCRSEAALQRTEDGLGASRGRRLNWMEVGVQRGALNKD